MNKPNPQDPIETLQSKHAEMVTELMKPGEHILESLTPEKCALLHMAVGVALEGAELLDAVKKHVFYNKPLDLDNVVEELGDSEFYMEGVRQVTRTERIVTLVRNMQKLGVRYEKGFSDEAAQARADKKEGQ